jgi:hypothetical protein
MRNAIPLKVVLASAVLAAVNAACGTTSRQDDPRPAQQAALMTLEEGKKGACWHAGLAHAPGCRLEAA